MLLTIYPSESNKSTSIYSFIGYPEATSNFKVESFTSTGYAPIIGP